MTVAEINKLIQELPSEERGKVSDTYHDFDTLYEFRNILFVHLINWCSDKAWKASKNADGQKWDGWFVAGIFPEPGQQITFHLPDKYWDSLNGILTFDVNPFYDGHSSEDVLNRLKTL